MAIGDAAAGSPGPSTQPGSTKPSRSLEVANLVLATLALAVSFGSVALSFWVHADQNERQREELAGQVVFVHVRGEPDFSVDAGQKPTVGPDSYTVANFGPFPIEDVVVETDAVPDPIDEALSEQLGQSPSGAKLVFAVQVGTVGPCQAANVSGQEFTHVVFTDLNGRRWSKAAGSPPSDDVPGPGVERHFPDIRDRAAEVYRTRLENCG